MGAFLSAIGGAGNAAGRYGEQIRGLLESRRHDFATLIGQAAQDEIDPGVRDDLRGIMGELATNKPIEKPTQKFLQIMQQRHQGNQALAQAFGGAPAEPPPPPPGPAGPGQTPGTVGQKPLTDGGAAQPALSPVQPQAQGGIPPAGPQDLNEVLGRFQARPEYQTAAGRQFLQPAMNAEIQQNEELRRMQSVRQMDLGERQKALSQLEASPEWKSLPDLMKSQYRLWAHSTAATIPSMAASLMRPINLPGTQPASEIPAEELIDVNGAAIDPKSSPYVREHMNLATGQRYFSPATGPMQTLATPEGLVNAPRLGELPPAAMPPSALTPRNTGVNPETRANQFGNAYDIRAGGPGLGVSAGSLTPERQFIAEYRAKNPNATVAQALEAYKKILPPQRTLVMEPVAGGGFQAKEVRSGSQVAPNSLTTGGMNTENVPTAQVRSMAARAPRVIELANRAMEILDANEKNLGPLASRWQEFTAGKVGLPNKGYTQLRTVVSGLLSTALMNMHVGASGGEAMMKHFHDLIDSSIQDPANLRDALGEIVTYANQVAKEGKSAPAIPPVSVTIRVRRKADGATGSLDQKDFDASKYEKIEVK